MHAATTRLTWNDVETATMIKWESPLIAANVISQCHAAYYICAQIRDNVYDEAPMSDWIMQAAEIYFHVVSFWLAVEIFLHRIID